jgi:CBS domain-containing protein
MLRGLLGLVMEWPRATRWATATGQMMAVGMGTWGVMGGQLMLVLIAVMIFVAASATDADERAHTVLSTQRVGDACNRHAITLGETDRVSTVIGYLLTSYQPDFAVLRGRRLLGVVRRSDVIAALAHRAGDPPVSAIMSHCATVSADGSLADTRRVLQESPFTVAAVFHDGTFIGLVSDEDIAEAETVLAFVRARAAGGPTPGAVRQSHAPAEA